MASVWLTTPFRRSLVNPWATEAGFGDFGQALSNFHQQMVGMQKDMDRMFEDFNSLTPAVSCREFRDAEFRGLDNPFMVGKDGSKKMQMHFDVRHFKPEEISIKTKDGKYLEVAAKHEDKSDGGHVYREYKRMFSIPEEVDVQGMDSRLNEGGVLVIEAPLKAPAIEAAPKEQKLQITHE